MIQFVNVVKFFGSKAALDNVSCKIEKGEFVLITGASGAGKSTFLKLIFCEEKPYSGNVLVFGKNIVMMKKGLIPFFRRNIGFIFQDFRLIKNRTVSENVALAMQLLGKRNSEVKRGVNNILRVVGLEHKKESYPTQLSGGEQQRACIARALINNPAILLADEPTGNLDHDMAMEISTLIKNINSMGTVVIVASHNPSLFDNISGFHTAGRRILNLQHGKITVNTLTNPERTKIEVQESISCRGLE